MTANGSPAQPAGTGCDGAGRVEQHSSHPLNKQSSAENQPPRWTPCVCAPDEAIVALWVDGDDRWTAITPVGPLSLTTRQLLQFSQFRLKAMRRLLLFVEPQSATDEWYRIVNEAMRPLREPQRASEASYA